MISDSTMSPLMKRVYKHLIQHGSASVFELKKLGIRNPPLVIKWLRQNGVGITTYYQKTVEVNGLITYGHYRYRLDVTLFKTKKMPQQSHSATVKHLTHNKDDVIALAEKMKINLDLLNETSNKEYL